MVYGSNHEEKDYRCDNDEADNSENKYSVVNRDGSGCCSRCRVGIRPGRVTLFQNCHQAGEINPAEGQSDGRHDDISHQ
jgi:hypothetical protein